MEIFAYIYVAATVLRDLWLGFIQSVSGWFLGGNVDWRMAATVAGGIALYKAIWGLGGLLYLLPGARKDMPLRVTPRMLELYGSIVDEWHVQSVTLAERQIGLLEDLITELRRKSQRDPKDYLGAVYLGENRP
jgi:hypothetical protein